MRKILFVLSILAFALAGCTDKDNEFVIVGEIADNSCDGAQIFLVPLTEPATHETVDSVVIRDRKFEFRGTKARVASLRLQMPQRLKFQELLVYTEPGTIKAHVAEFGSVTGTKNNDLLQQWKGIQESCVQARSEALESCNNDTRSLEYAKTLDSLKVVMGNATFNFVKASGLNPLSRFFYSGNRSNLTDAQKKELEYMEIDLQHQLDSIRQARSAANDKKN